jgi:hypothetical protein
MGSSSEYAPGPGSPAASEAEAGDEPEVAETGGGFDDLRRQSAAMLQTLADQYDTESENSRSRSAQLLAESETAGALAVKLAEESVRIRTEADRLAAEPSWMTGGSETTPDSSGTADGAPGSATKAESVASGDAAGGATAEHGTTASGSTPAPGPGPARGFAPNAGSESSQVSDSGPTGQTSGSDDWAPRPFESWRNQASQVTPTTGAVTRAD